MSEMPKLPRRKPQRNKRGQGSVVPYGETQWRARKRKRGFKDLFGTVRETFDEALADLDSLHFPDPLKPRPVAVETFGEFVRKQLAGPRQAQVAYGTWKREEITWRTRILGSDLGECPLNVVTREMVQAWVDGLRKLRPMRDQDGRPIYVGPDDKVLVRNEKGKLPAGVDRMALYEATDEPLSISGVGREYATVSLYLDLARRRGLVVGNPAEDVVLPKQTRQVKAAAKKARKSLTPQQAAKLATNLANFRSELRTQGDRFEAMVLTQRDTGLRRGELCAIQWSQVKRDDSGPFIVVDQALSRRQRGFELGPTKTGSVRVLPITEETYARIQDQPRRSEFVFTTEAGKKVSPDNYTKYFAAFRDAIGLPNLTSHNLRHTYISLMLRAGVDLKTIQTNVGHSSPRMIMEVYGETFNESQRDSANRLQALLAAAAEEEATA